MLHNIYIHWHLHLVQDVHANKGFERNKKMSPENEAKYRNDKWEILKNLLKFLPLFTKQMNNIDSDTYKITQQHGTIIRQNQIIIDLLTDIRNSQDMRIIVKK